MSFFIASNRLGGFKFSHDTSCCGFSTMDLLLIPECFSFLSFSYEYAFINVVTISNTMHVVYM